MIPDVSLGLQSSSGNSMPLLADRMKAATAKLHSQAENRLFMENLIAKKVSKKAYIQYLADLKPIYETLEKALETNKEDIRLASLVIPELFRTDKIVNDLKFFQAEHAPASQEAKNHAQRIHEIAEWKPHLLIAHAYARYLGDLHGGQIIGKSVKEMWGEEGSHFYSYDELKANFAYSFDSLGTFARRYYRNFIDQLPLKPKESDEVVEEAINAFELSDEMLANLSRNANL